MKKIIISIIMLLFVGIIAANGSQLEDFDNIKDWQDLKVYIIKSKNFFSGPAYHYFSEDGTFKADIPLVDSKTISDFGSWKIDPKDKIFSVRLPYHKETNLYQSYFLKKEYWKGNTVCRIILYTGKKFIDNPEEGYLRGGYTYFESVCKSEP